MSITLSVADVEVEYVHEFDHDQLEEHPTSTGSLFPVRVSHIPSTAPTTYTPPGPTQVQTREQPIKTISAYFVDTVSEIFDDSF